MKNLFKKFRETGKIEDYLKYRSELAKEETTEVEEHANNKDKGDCNQDD